MKTSFWKSISYQSVAFEAADLYGILSLDIEAVYNFLTVIKSKSTQSEAHEVLIASRKPPITRYLFV